jgi:hypothetical protein
MAEARAIAVDLAALTREDGSFRTMLAWGDPVSVLDEDSDRLKVEITDYATQSDGSIIPKKGTGFIKRRFGTGSEARDVAVPADQVNVLKIDFVDLQQGDGTLIETPGGRTITLDGGKNQLFARYLAARFPGTSTEQRKEIDAMVITHGDADHFAGLAEIHDSETNPEPRKRLFAHPRRVYHNGLVKRPSTVPESESFGATQKLGSETIITALESDLTAVPDSDMNTYFERWKRVLKAWQESGAILFRRLGQGDDNAFDFLADEDVDVQVLGPILTTRDGVTGLRFLERPQIDGPELIRDAASTGLDASYTINGHSIVLRLTFGNWRMLFAGDLNTLMEQALTQDHVAGHLDLRAEIFRVPHHGSAELSGPFLEAVLPLISVVSPGEESTRREYVYPRASLMSSLGRHARDASPLVFVAELVADLEAVGWVRPDTAHGVNDRPPTASLRDFFAFRRTAYGLVRVRTDGERLLVYTNPETQMKEAYAYAAPAPGDVTPVLVRKA